MGTSIASATVWASRLLCVDDTPTSDMPPLAGCDWWMNTVWNATQHIRAELSESRKGMPYTTMHLCAGSGTDLLALQARRLASAW